VITASLANLLWWLQQFFNLKFWICTGICRRYLTFTDEIALLEQIKNKPPNSSHCQLVEIIGVPKFTGDFTAGCVPVGCLSVVLLISGILGACHQIFIASKMKCQ
jgi:hypothetical protein